MTSEDNGAVKKLTASEDAEWPGRILVVDDDETLRFIARKALQGEGLEVIEADSGEQALARLETEAVDAVLLDACMPGISGFETCKQILSKTQHMKLPVIMATGLSDEASVEQAFAVGASDYITKPINWQILKKRLRSLADSARAISKDTSREEQLFEATGDAAITVDSKGRIVSVRHATALPKALFEEVSNGLFLFSCLPQHARAEAMNAWRDCRSGNQKSSFVVTHDDIEHPFAIEARLLPAADGLYLCLIKDFSDKYLAEQRVYALAHHDQVTGLVNSKLFVERLELTMQRDRTLNQQTTIYRFVIDNYRDLHSKLNQRELDQLAQEYAGRLKAVFGAGVTEYSLLGGQTTLLARLSDHEFSILLSGVGEAQMDEHIRSAVQRLAQPFVINHHRLHVRSITGLSSSPEAGRDAESLMESARYACAEGYESDEEGIRASSPQLRKQAAKRAQIEQLLRSDLECGKLHMNYQSKLRVENLELEGIEALIRWNNEKYGVISPAEFIPLAERAGLMAPLTDFVIASVLDQSVSWERDDLSTAPIAVNIPNSVLARKGIVEELESALSQRGLEPKRLEIEVTEGMMVASGGKAIEHLHQLRECGIRIAIDDFGTGYSSFSYLRQLPVDILKIDMSFVHKIHEDPTSLAIARAIVSVGHDIGLQVVAEGVESALQLQKLREIGCDVVQGYYTGSPMMAANFHQQWSVEGTGQ